MGSLVRCSADGCKVAGDTDVVRKLFVFCNDCRKPICLACQKDHEDGHSFGDYITALNDRRQMLAQMHKTVDEKVDQSSREEVENKEQLRRLKLKITESEALNRRLRERQKSASDILIQLDAASDRLSNTMLDDRVCQMVEQLGERVEAMLAEDSSNVTDQLGDINRQLTTKIDDHI